MIDVHSVACSILAVSIPLSMVLTGTCFHQLQRFFRILRARYPIHHHGIGSPDEFGAATTHGKPLLGYFLDKDYLSVPDPHVGRLGDRIRALYFLGGALLATAIVAVAIALAAELAG